MAADYLRLYNKALAVEILRMDRDALARFVEGNLVDVEDIFRQSFVTSQMKEWNCSAGEAIDRMIESGWSFDELKVDVIHNTAFNESKDDITLDYYGCFAVVFDQFPDDMIVDHSPFYYLMRPAHIDKIVKSLRAHRDELKFTGDEGIEKIEKWRDFCIENPGYLVAYMNDIGY